MIATTPEPVRYIQAQPGFQTSFLSTEADIAVGGGAAGAGKTFALLLEPMRHIEVNPDFGAVCFRRTYPMIKNEGGLWDESRKLYPLAAGRANENDAEWRFPSGAKIKFNHLQHEKNIYDFQGAQIPLIMFDELTHFSEKMFFYLLSRNRSTCGVKPYVRATCNPDPDSWVARFLAWWIDEEGWPIPERAGVLRYFIRDGDTMVWGDTKAEVLKKVPHLLKTLPVTELDSLVKSVTFIPGTIYENQELLKINPEYIGSLLALDEATKSQLLDGNWKVKPDAQSLIDYVKMMDTLTNTHVPEGRRYLTADIAMHGSDLFVIGVWSGLRLVDIRVLEKSDGHQVETAIREMARAWSVPISNIAYDADGVGAYLKGYLSTARPFNNGASPIAVGSTKVNYKNLKTQCYYLLAKDINEARLYVTESVAAQIVKGKAVKDHMFSESRAIKRNKPDADGKLQIIPKEQMKNMLNGRSPDFMDMLMMRKVFDIRPVAYAAPRVLKSR